MTTRTARRLPVQQGPAAWNEILGPAPAPDPLSQNKTADVIIVGGGIAGLAAARRLLQIAPCNIVLLEAGRIAEGAAGRNSGFMIDLPHELTSEDYQGSGNDREIIALNRQAIAFAQEAVTEFGIDANFFDPLGKVNGAASDAAHDRTRSYARHLDSLGEPHEMLDETAMAELTGSRHYRSGLHTPGTVMVQPAGYVRGLAAGLSRQIHVHEQSPVAKLLRVGPDWVTETAQGQSVTAPKVIMATNGHIENFGFHAGELLHVFLFASMTQELEAEALVALGGAPRWGVTPADPLGTTMRRIDRGQGGNRIVTRTAAVVRSGMQATAADLARATQIQRQKFEARFPQLKGVAMDYSWAGQLCLTKNSVSLVREAEGGLFLAAAQNGLGLTRGTLSGIAAAELACSAESDVTRFFAAEAEPDRLPPTPIRDFGANALIRWKEWRARAE